MTPLIRLSVTLDDNKYALRYVLDLIERRLPKARMLAKDIETGEAPYPIAGHGIMLAHTYRTAIGVFSLYHSGNALCKLDETGCHLSFRYPEHGEAYLALDYAVMIEESSTNVIGTVLAWLRFPNLASPIAKQIGESVKVVGKDRLIYAFDVHTAEEVVKSLPNPESWNLVPPSWIFPWGSQDEVMALWNSLIVRCTYHLLAINFGAHRLQITGGGVDDLCLRIRQGELVQNIHRLSRVPLNRIVRFVHSITFGHDTRTPDPALQPLIPCGRDELLVPCMHIISSKSGRNLLSLHARINEQSFNSQSAAFEAAMIKDVAALASEHFPFTRTQVEFKATGEIDLVIVDDTSATILIGELRWMIPPGDVRETINRTKVCREKVTQTEKKIKILKKDTVSFLRQLRCIAAAERWNVVGFVVTKNFVFRSFNAEIPMLPLEVLRAGFNERLNAQELHTWLKSESWLPQENEHFEVVREQFEFGSYTLDHVGIKKPRPLKYLREFLPTSAKSFLENLG